MTFTKAMIDLAKEIRRRAPTEEKPSLKMANPHLFEELAKLFHRTQDAVMKALIKEICQLAGEPWHSILEQHSKTEDHSIRTYRGQTQLTPKVSAQSPSNAQPKAKRIYRGQVVQPL